jgi:hypothetical protein
VRLLPVALLAALSLACSPAQPAGTTAAGGPAASAPVASAPFYLEPGPDTVIVTNGFTGQTEAVIAAPKSAGSWSWNSGHTVWYPCGAAPDDRTFLLCGADQYWELRLGDDGKPQSMTAPAAIPVAARNTGSNGNPYFAVSPDVRFAAVTTATGNITVLSLVTGAIRSWTVPSGGSATSLSWAGDRYLEFQFSAPSGDNDAGGVRLLDTASPATAALAASRLVISGERKLADGITGVFNPVITPDGSKIVAGAWTSFNVAGLAEFSAQTGQFLAMLIPASSMPGHGSPCQVLWTDLSGAHLIASCGPAGVVNGTRFTSVGLHVPNTSGITFFGLFW